MNTFLLQGTIFLSSIVVCFFLKEIIVSDKKLFWIPEASLLMLGGFLTIFLFRLLSPSHVDFSFNSTVFYYILLPPIIFNTGLDIDFKCFISNLFAIVLYANLGTFINCVVVCFFLYSLGQIGLSEAISVAEGMSFGSLISATDPVTTLVVFDKFQVEKSLFGIILGVSILDDAVAVLIFQLCNDLVSSNSFSVGKCFGLIGLFLAKYLGSLIFGYVAGVGYAKLITRISQITDDFRPPQMVCLLLLFSYLIFFVAESFWLSGIISVLYSAIYWKKTQNLETEDADRYNVSKAFIGGVATTCESLTFYLIGLSLLSSPLTTSANWGFFGWSLIACMAGRALQIYPLALLINSLNNRQSGVSAAEINGHGTAAENVQLQAVTETSVTVEPNRVIDSHTFSWVAVKELFYPNPRTAAKLPLGYQHMILLAGLRGPIAYSTSQLFNNANGHVNLIVGTTAITVVFTTFLFGALTMPALDLFRIPYVKEVSTSVSEETIHDREELNPMQDIEIVALKGSWNSTNLGRGYEDSYHRVNLEFNDIISEIPTDSKSSAGDDNLRLLGNDGRK
jgi:NhaP-type Na+/H+ or K+/H+ antiporter